MSITEAYIELESYKALKKYICSLGGKIKQFDFEIASAKLDVTQSTKSVAEKVQCLEKLKLKAESKHMELLHKEEAITDAVNAIQDERLGYILTQYFFEGKTLEKICVDMNYCYRWTKTLKSKAVECYRAERSL